MRRMEGVELHPWLDERGHHQFDEDEVREVAKQLKEHGHREASVENKTPANILEIQLRSAQRKAIQLETENYRLKTRILELEGEVRKVRRNGARYERDLTDVASAALDAAYDGSTSKSDLLRQKLALTARRWNKSPFG